jgi:hypothetical protein
VRQLCDYGLHELVLVLVGSVGCELAMREEVAGHILDELAGLGRAALAVVEQKDVGEHGVHIVEHPAAVL